MAISYYKNGTIAKTENEWKKTILDDNYIYISHLDEGLQYWILPCTPESVSDSMKVSFQSQNALGRSAPVYVYSNSGPREVQINLKIHRDLMDDVNMSKCPVILKENEDYVDSLIHALQAVAVPKYNLSNKAIEPPLVALRLSNEIFIKGVATSAPNINYELPILSNGKYAQVSFSINIAEVDPYDASEIYKNGSFRGLVSTLKNKGMGY